MGTTLTDTPAMTGVDTDPPTYPMQSTLTTSLPVDMRTTLFALTLALASVGCVTSGEGHTCTALRPPTALNTPLQHRETSCPEGSERAYNMVENFLTNPNLSDARQETGTTSLSPDQIQLIQDENVCQQLDSEFSEFTDEYAVTYYKVGSFYFATQILKQPDSPSEVLSGLMMIYVLDSNLNFIKGYSG